MLRVIKVAAVLSVASVGVASAAPGLTGARPTTGTHIELARAGGESRISRECDGRRCQASRRSSERRREARHRDRSASSERRSHRRAVRVGRDSSDAPRSCLTSAARSLLSRIEGRFGAVRVISTCRPGATIAGSGRPSRHASGNAVDFDAGGRKSEIVSWLIANHKSGGTMTYPAMNHIHVDIGQHFVSIAGGRHYASWSSRGKSSRSYRVARNDDRSTKRVSIRRGPTIAQRDSDDD